MSAEMSSESMEVITMAIDKHAQTKNYEVSFLVLTIALQITPVYTKQLFWTYRLLRS